MSPRGSGRVGFAFHEGEVEKSDRMGDTGRICRKFEVYASRRIAFEIEWLLIDIVTMSV